MSVSPAEFRSALGRWPSGVCVVTTRSTAGPAGLTVSAFCSVSLVPPLIAVCIDRQANTLPSIVESGSFAVNILAADQRSLSDRFAQEDEGVRFDGVPLLEVAGAKSPFLAGAVAHLDCELDAKHDAGDHVICVGRVSLSLLHAGEPLVFHASRYRSLAQLVQRER